MTSDFNLNIETIDQLDKKTSHYELLGVEKSANSFEIKRAFIKQKQMHDRNSLALYSLTDDEMNKKALDRLMQAYNVLSCDLSRENYDRELAGKPRAKHVEHKFVRKDLSSSEAKNEKFSQLEKIEHFDGLAKLHGLGSGQQMKSFRKWLGIEIQELQHVTKISHANLQSIENESFQLLPDVVYVKGFLRCCFKYYGLPNLKL